MGKEAKMNGKKKIQMENGKTDEFKCDVEVEGVVCGRPFPELQNLRNHMRRYHKSAVHACTWKECNAVFKHPWDLTAHVNGEHRGLKPKCPNCGNEFSKKSNLHNHLHRGKGCPALRGSPDFLIQKKEAERNNVKRREEKVKQETGEESDKEPSDLVIDDRDQSDIMDTSEVNTETEEDQVRDPEEQIEVSRVEVQEPRGNNFQSPGLDFLQAQRDLLRPRKVSESNSTPSPPPGSSLLMLLADVAMNQSKYSDSSREGSPVDVQRVTPPPLNLTTSRAPAIRPSPPLVTTYRDIRPVPVTRVVTATGQPLKRLQPAAGQPIKYVPLPVQTTAPAPVMVIQGNGAPVPQTNGSAGPVPLTNGSPGHVPQTNGSPGHVSHVPSGLIQLAQTTQVIRLPPGGASLLRTNTANVPSQAPTQPVKTKLVKIDQDTHSDSDQETDSGSDSGSSSGLSGGGGAHVKCPTCSRVCSDAAHLSHHIKHVHSGHSSKLVQKKTWKCHTCNKMFGRSSHLKEHIKSVHEGNKRVYKRAKCTHCGQVFARPSSLNQHITQAHGAVVNN